jgi:hypothetical protein
MSKIKFASVFGTIALLASACSPQGAPESTQVAAPAATAPTAPVKAHGAPASSAHQIGAALVAEKRQDAPSSCSIETVDGAQFTDAPAKVTKKQISVAGWFLPEISKKTGSPASLRLVEESGAAGWEVSLSHWTSRPKVIAAMHGVDTGNAGFAETFDIHSVAPGKYHLILVFKDSGVARVCDKGRKLEIQ